ncbi:MAG TPA: hypothetical protein VK158_05380 [Acidobacteriota bacterium]|nr:hypothetical protein [Acidobacteriota bacterium]
MPSHNIVIPSLKLKFSGKYSIAQVDQSIKNFLAQHEYVLEGINNDASVSENSKEESLTYSCSKQLDHHKVSSILIAATYTHAQPTKRTRSGGWEQIYEGDVTIEFKAVIKSYGHLGIQHDPKKFFFGFMFKRFIMGSENVEQKELAKTVTDMYAEIHGLLQINNFESSGPLAGARHA